jgi:hypothetical protein
MLFYKIFWNYIRCEPSQGLTGAWRMAFVVLANWITRTYLIRAGPKVLGHPNGPKIIEHPAGRWWALVHHNLAYQRPHCVSLWFDFFF